MRFMKSKLLIHKYHSLIEPLSQTIDVLPEFIEINLCQVMFNKKGIKISFIEYSGTKDASEIVGELNKSIDDGYLIINTNGMEIK